VVNPCVSVERSNPHVGQNRVETWASVPQREQNIELETLS
jgi:hypothetical protein